MPHSRVTVARRVRGVAAAVLLCLLALRAEAGRVVVASSGQRYELGYLVAEGGFGRVYKGWRIQRGRRPGGSLVRGAPVAIKRFWSEDAAIEEARALRSVAGVKHMQKLLGDGYDETADEDFLVTGWVNGRGLGAWAQAKRRSPTEIVRVMIRASAIVSDLHAHGVLHLDIKPGNILVDARGASRRPQVTIIDVGIARQMGADGAVASSPYGTYEFMPPEQRAKGRADARADVFGLAGTLYYLIADDYPVVRGAGKRPIARHLDRIADPELRAIVARGLAVNPADRYPTARDLGRALSRWKARQARRQRAP